MSDNDRVQHKHLKIAMNRSKQYHDEKTNALDSQVKELDSQVKDIANQFTSEQKNDTFILKFKGNIIAQIPLFPSTYGDIITDVKNLEITEGNTGTFTVCLSDAPTSKQRVTIVSNNSNVTVEPSSLTFSSSNYNIPQTVTVSAIDDSIEDNDYTLNLTLSSNNVASVIINITVKDNDLLIAWHTITSDEVTGINSNDYLLATYEGTESSVIIPDTLNSKSTQLNIAGNKNFDTNGVIINLKISNNVTGTFTQGGGGLPRIKRIENIGAVSKFIINSSSTLEKIKIENENSTCTEFTMGQNISLVQINGLDKLTALTSCQQSFNGCTSLTTIGSFPPNLTNTKLMFWKCSALTSVPSIDMELTSWQQMFLGCNALTEITVNAMNGCGVELIGYDSSNGTGWNGGNFTFKCKYNSDMYKSFRNMICSSSGSSEKLFIETLDNVTNPITDIVMWGDSMTRAGNTTMGNMPDQLARMLSNDVMVWNYGISGNTIQTAGTRFEKHPETYGKASVIWLGTNNTNLTGEEMCSLIQSTFIDKLTTDKYIVVGLLTSNYTDEKNQAFVNAFGDKFLNIREYFLTNMWTISGLTATNQDNTDLSNGLIPTSFRVDGTHLNPNGGKVVATAIKEKLLSLGYISLTQVL